MVNGEQQLPDGWALKTIDQLYDVLGGGTPSTAIPEYWNGDIPWITSADIAGLKDIQPRKRITKNAIANSSTYLVPARSLIVVTRVSLGKVALTSYPLCFSQDSQALIAKDKSVLPEYALYYLSQATQIFKYQSRGTTISGVTKKQLKELPFPLPPLPEQERIVAKIEELLTQLEAGTSALERVEAGLGRYKASVLKAGAEGNLVDSNLGIGDEPAAEILQRYEYEPLCTVEFPLLPDRWCYTKIDALLSETRTGLKTGPFGSLLKKHEHRGSGVPVFGIENIGKMEFVPGSKIYITEEKARQLEGYAALPGDILISRSGTVGEVCVVPENIGEARISTNVMRVVLNQEIILPKFFVMLFNGAPYVLDQVTELCKGSTRDFLNQSILKSIVFPLPPLEEQRRIVAEVERRLSVAREVESVVEKVLVRGGRLRQAVLRSAFEGRL